MKEVEKKDLPDIPGGLRPPYPGETEGQPGIPKLPGLEDYPGCPTTPIEPNFE